MATSWIKVSASLLAAGAIAFATSPAQASEIDTGAGFTPEQFKVFVDEPTGFSFVKTPAGWKFMRKLDEEQVKLAVELEHDGTPGITVAHLPSDVSLGLARNSY